jgi:hypothetical protein
MPAGRDGLANIAKTERLSGTMATKQLAARCALSLAGMLLVSGASAQDSATAGALFEKGVADMEASHFDTACPAIEESQRIDPRPGTLFTLAECDAHWGKVASAAAQYQEYVDLVSRLTGEQQKRHKARADIARAQLAKLKPTVPTLTLVLPADAPPGTFVTRNGEELKGAALGLPLPVDPGQYVIVTHVPGGAEHETKVSIQLGEAKRVPLEATKSATLPAPPVASTAPLEPAPSADSQAEAERGQAHGNGRKTAAYVAGGVGVAGIVVGSVTGILVFSKKHTVTGNCTGASCSETGLDAANSGKTLATISDVGFGVGIAGLALGTILWLSGGSESASAEHARTTSFQPMLVGTNGGFAAGLLRRW